MIGLDWTALRTWFDKNFTFKGAILFVIWVAKSLPDLFGRTDFWSKNVGWVWGHLYKHGTLSVTVLCGLLIWLDHRRVIAKNGPRPHDTNTLRGRTLRLRDDIGRFLISAGKKPEVQRASDMSTADYLKAAWGAALPWTNKIMYGYERRFKDVVYQIHLEYGELNLLPGLSVDVPDHVNSEEQIAKVIDDLSVLAGKLND